MARLRIEQGKSQGKSVEFDRQAIVGRGETAQLQIADIKASREHCKIFEQGGTWAVADLNSRNGIKVNGIQTTRKSLSHGDKIEIGETVMVFELTGAAAASPADTADLPAVKIPVKGAGAQSAASSPKPAASSPAARSAAPAASKGAPVSKKEAAMAEARAAAAKSAAPAAKAGAPAKTAANGAPAAAADKGLKVSDHVLQFHKVEAKNATLMDIDLEQSPALTKFMILLACVGFVALTIWFVASMLGEG